MDLGVDCHQDERIAVADKMVDLPSDMPGSLTLDQAKAAVGAFGYKITMAPKDPPSAPVGFAKT